ncbi:MAG: hypothetical protein CV080_06505 [Candidatus Kuenenia stuttgartiensis]|nr:MAG: hypothetical protein CV080_06505 [Candidatus Kuenenia stuttgartiensis]
MIFLCFLKFSFLSLTDRFDPVIYKTSRCMEKINTFIAKITRPKIAGIFPRERLFRLMDKGRDKPVIWISAPAGSGKTTLAASYLNSRKLSYLWYRVDEGDADIATFFYSMGIAVKKAVPSHRKPLPLLTPEYQQSIPLFTKRYFEELYSRLTSPWIIVFDNIQDAPVNSLFHKTLTSSLDIIPDGISIIAVSRNDPPPHYASISANNKSHLIGREEVRFTMKESKEILLVGAKKRIANTSLTRLYTQTEGWAAGLVLIAEHIRTKGLDDTLRSGSIYEKAFDYFANEIFIKTDKKTQIFLLKTAFLPRMTIHMAEKLTGVSESGRILHELTRKNYFTTAHYQKETIYQYHPLFREFLLSRARDSFDTGRLSAMQRKAAALLGKSGQIEDAALLFINVGDWDGLIKLTCSHASSLIAQGRTKTLVEWITNIPEETRDNEPWILYWHGVCKLSYNLTESRGCFDRAFMQFRAWNEQTGMWLSWSYAVDTIFHEFEDFPRLDNYASLFDDIFQKRTPFPSFEVELRVLPCRFFIMAMREPNHPEIDKWAHRVFLCLQECREVNLRLQLGFHLAVHYLWMGDFANVGIVINSISEGLRSETILPMERLLWENTKAMYAWLTGSVESCLRTVSEALKLSCETGIHFWDHHLLSFAACAALSDGDIETANGMIRKIASGLTHARKIDIIFYHFLCAWRDLTSGNLSSAAEHMRIHTSLVAKIGAYLPVAVNHVAAAHIFAARGEYREAISWLNRAQQIGRQTKSKLIKHMCLLTKAWLALECSGKGTSEEEGLAALRKAMSFGREHRFINCFLWRPEVVSRLCIKALEAGIEAEYVRELVRTRKLVPDTPPLGCENWPWPLKIFTLGRFTLLKEDSPVSMSGKVPRKPLELIKAIISLGSKEVSIDRVTNMLWSDTEGDMAHHAFESTLYRLRRLIGNDAAIKLQGGHLSLDSRYCWVDVWVFERLLEEIAGASVSEKPVPLVRPDVLKLFEKAFDLYKGCFLPADISCLWTVSIRKSLQKKFFRLVMLSGNYLERAKQWQMAVEYYERAIEIDNLAEEFYQRLMMCHHMLDKRLEAVKVYHHLRNALSSVYQITPSPETEALYRSILSGTNKPECKKF